MSEENKKLKNENMRKFDERDEKEPIRMFSWFTTDKLDKKAYWIFLLILFIFYVISNISIFFR
ncbi:MAG: hypothetical protein CVV00_09255 [Firmicutes bacterium HGW-Firmicutes-5]|nr:MAG: hypothetical protein CVV00_09255 [Firmicutes bacterium HGW-Firmicutes-5]